MVINYRGLAGAKLKTSRLYCGTSFEDILEPIQYYSEIFKKEKRKCF